MLRPQPHRRFEPFNFLSGSHALDYIRHTDDFPIGFIGGGPIGPTQARATIEESYQMKYGPIIHLALAPHDGSLGFGHDKVVVLNGLPDKHTTIVADAVVVPKIFGPFAVETLLGDCSCNIVANPDWIGFIHAGTPELFEGLLDNFEGEWRYMDQSHVFMGPCITGRNYAYDPEKVPEKYKSFLLEADGSDTIFDDGYTFGLAEAVYSELDKWGAASLDNCLVDPFTENLGGGGWASARYYQFLKNVRGAGDGLSPRDMALFHFEPAA
ncbi:MAG: hypothetical protein WCP91_01165 [Candidatus Berkelbacteria bacterium]